MRNMAGSLMSQSYHYQLISYDYTTLISCVIIALCILRNLRENADVGRLRSSARCTNRIHEVVRSRATGYPGIKRRGDVTRPDTLLRTVCLTTSTKRSEACVRPVRQAARTQASDFSRQGTEVKLHSQGLEHGKHTAPTRAKHGY